jgi:radical SAM superfamily enzyme YgiQ (UPF0313 family)
MNDHLLLAAIDEEARPLSIRVLGAYAESLGVRTTLLVILRKLAAYGSPVACTDSEVRQLAGFLKTENVTHVGFYLMTASLRPYANLVGRLREAGFNGVIMAGGVHPTLCPEESLVPGATYAVHGPGELPLRLLFEGAAPASIPGLVWRDGERVVVNRQASAQRLALDDIPFPIFRFDRDLILVDGKLQPFTWKMHSRHASWNGRVYDTVTSRGCVYRCSYCCNVYGAPVYRASVDRIVRELRNLREAHPRIRGVNIHDDSFFAGSEEWVRDFCTRMREEVALPFIVRMIPRFVTPERVELLKSGGLRYVTMGLEGSTRINRVLFNRKEDGNSFVKAARAVLAAGLPLSIDYIIHNPYETEDDLREVATTLNALPRPNWWIVSLSLTPFPGTPLYARCARDRMLDRFATDAYEAMLNPSKPGGYRTPAFWLDLITVVLPHVPPELGAKLIAAGPGNARAAETVRRLATTMRATKRFTTSLQQRAPLLYRAVSRALRTLGGRRGKHVTAFE